MVDIFIYRNFDRSSVENVGSFFCFSVNADSALSHVSMNITSKLLLFSLKNCHRSVSIGYMVISSFALTARSVPYRVMYKSQAIARTSKE